MIDRPYRTMAKLLGRAGLGLGLLVPLLLAACGRVPVVEKADSATEVRRATPTTRPANPMVPDFRLPDLDGKTWTLSQFQGQPVMLFFWATW
jgi:cytochrome oxidase Cu insertion factor (SCO1/SenC/PrrC family)